VLAAQIRFSAWAGVQSAHATEGLGHQRDTSMVLSRSGYEQPRDERIRSRHRAVAELSFGKGSRRDDGFDEWSGPISEEKSGQLASNPGKNIGSKIKANRTRGAETSFYSDSTTVWLRKERACFVGNPSEYQAALSRPHWLAFRITEQRFCVFHRPPRIELREVFPKKQAHDPFGEICWKIQ
jgi:hypothetical protein